MKIQYKWFFVFFFIFLGLLLSACQQNTSTPTSNSEGALVGSEDFNRDNKDDLAIGVPKENINSKVDAGAVNVIYGSYTDLSSAGDQIWHQDLAGMTDLAGSDEQFGYALAIGDFDGNGKNDLAVGVPGDWVSLPNDNAGAVHIIYGYDTSGLDDLNNEWLIQSDGTGDPNGSEASDKFGSSLAVGDFNDDGKDDLAVGVPGEDTGTTTDNGAIHVFYGSTAGLENSSIDDLFFDEDAIWPFNINENYAQFGFSLAAADFNGDGKDDLAVSTPFDDLDLFFPIFDTGTVTVIYGDENGLTNQDATTWSQDGGLLETSEAGDNFGYALTACDYNNDGRADLAIGAHLENIGGIKNAGIVHVLYGSITGIVSAGNQVWHQNTAGILDSAERNDKFARALSSGDFNGDGACDLAIGVPFENISGNADGGVVNVLYGSSTGIVATGNQLWHQNSAGIRNSVQANDRFGWSLAAGDFNGDKKDDLAIGIPLEDFTSASNAGAVSVIYGSTSGLTSVADDFWHQNSGGIKDIAEKDDWFGWSLAAKR